MRKYPFVSVFIALSTLALFFVSCGQPQPTPPSIDTPTPTITVTSTLDACALDNIGVEIQKVNRLMREFDDAAALSSYTTRDELKPTIENLQRIRRSAEDLSVPSCLKSLKELELTHMNMFIQTLLAFMGTTDQDAVNQGLVLSRRLHDQYMIEMARLQGKSILPMPTLEPTPVDPKASPATMIPTPSVPIVTNLGPGGIDIRLDPALDGLAVGMLAVGQSALALGQTQNGDWIMIEVPGQQSQNAWVYAPLAQLSGPAPLPILSPKP